VAAIGAGVTRVLTVFQPTRAANFAEVFLLAPLIADACNLELLHTPSFEMSMWHWSVVDSHSQYPLPQARATSSARRDPPGD